MPRVREVHPLGRGERIVASARAADVEGTSPDRASVSVAIGDAEYTSRGSLRAATAVCACSCAGSLS